MTYKTSFQAIRPIAAISLLALATPVGPALAQSDPAATTEVSRIAIVKGHDVYVRCGAAESYYPFLKLTDGDYVKVTGSKFEWSRVAPIGPAFDNGFGFIKYQKGDTGKFRLAADGRTGVTLSKIDIIAPNLELKYNHGDSWKSLAKLDADQTLRVVDKIETDKDTIVKVELPESAQGWVSTAYLETATAEQTKTWNDMLASHTRSKTEAAKASKTPNVPTARTNPPATEPAKPDAPLVRMTTAAPDPTAASTTFVAVDNESSNTPVTPAPVDATTSAVPAAPAATAKTNEPKLPGWEDLEAALKRLQREPIENAEVMPLRELYLDLAQRSASNPTINRYANGRADQLKVWADLQQKRQEVEAARIRAKMSADEAIAMQKALESSAEYVAVGRVAASTIYDGKNLPKLLRLQDGATGRTIAYLQPDEQYELVNLIGNLVGIVGEKNYDGAMRLNVIDPKRIDLLMPEERSTTVNAPTEH